MSDQTDQHIVRARSMLGVAVRRRRPAAEIDEARRDLAAAKIAAYIARTTAEAPRLSPAQRARLAALLLSDGDE